MKASEALKNAIKTEVENMIWAAKKFADENLSKDDFQVYVKGNDVAIMFDNGNDGHLLTFNEKSGKLDVVEYNYFYFEGTQGELRDYERIEF